MTRKTADPKTRLSTEEVFTFETVTLNRRGEPISTTSGQAVQVYEDMGGGVHMDLVRVPGGAFQMGSHHEGGYEDERPIHPVFLQDFWLGKYPVTQAQWQAVMGRLPGCRFHGPDRPVENICWLEAAAFCDKLSKKAGRHYSLPSEAQWEYACRAGASTPFSLGETITTDYVNYVGNHTYRDEPPGIYRHGTTPVGSFLPNAWGLFDMHGNVWELCADSWSPDYTGAPVDETPRSSGRRPSSGLRSSRIAGLFFGSPPDDLTEGSGAYRVARGGSWHEPPAHCRSATRLRVEEGDRMEYFGLRVLLRRED